MDPSHSPRPQPGSQPGAQPGSDGLPPEERIRVLNERAGELTYAVASKLDQKGVAFARSLTSYDVTIAALNGMSRQTNYAIPPLPTPVNELPEPLRRRVLEGGCPPDGFFLTLKDNSIFYLHCAWAAVLKGLVPKESFPQLMDQGVMSVSAVAVEEYLDLLQSSARAFRDSSEEFIEAVSEIVAIHAAEQILGGHEPISTFPPRLDLQRAGLGGLVIAVASHQSAFLQSIAPGATVLIPGAGYNSTRNLAFMGACRQIQFVLNDRDPFVAAVLQKTLSILQFPNVKFIAGEMQDAAKRVPQIDVVLCGNLYDSSEENIRAFCAQVLQRAPLGTPFHVVQTESAGEDVHSTGLMWEKVLRELGYAIEASVPSPTLSQVRGEELSQAEAISLTGRELHVDLRRRASGESEGIREPGFTRYVLARTVTGAPLESFRNLATE